MTDDTFPPPDADEEALSAYLADDMTGVESAAFEQRLAAEPALAARLDALADALVALGGFDDVDVPTGFDDRLASRLASEDHVRPPTDLAAHRERRGRSQLWLGLGTAAAVLLVGVVMAGGALQGMGGVGGMADGGDSAGESAGVEEQADDRGDSDLAAGAQAGPGAPVILYERVAIADEQALQQRYSAVPEAQALLGVGLGEARRLENRFTKAVARRTKVPVAPEQQFSAGTAESGGEADEQGPKDLATKSAEPNETAEAPAAAAAPPPAPRRQDSCLEAIREDAQAPLVPVRVESVRYAGERAVAYVFVTAAPGAAVLDRTEVWVVRPRNCATLVFQQY